MRSSPALEPWSLLVAGWTPVLSTMTPQTKKSTSRPRPMSTSTPRENLSVQPVQKLGHSSITFGPVAQKLPLSKPELIRTFPTRSWPMMLLSRSRAEIHYLAMLVLLRF